METERRAERPDDPAQAASVDERGVAASPAAERVGSHALGATLAGIGGAVVGVLIGLAAGPLGSLAGAVLGALAGIALSAGFSVTQNGAGSRRR